MNPVPLIHLARLRSARWSLPEWRPFALTVMDLMFHAQRVHANTIPNRQIAHVSDQDPGLPGGMQYAAERHYEPEPIAKRCSKSPVREAAERAKRLAQRSQWAPRIRPRLRRRTMPSSSEYLGVRGSLGGVQPWGFSSPPGAAMKMRVDYYTITGYIAEYYGESPHARTRRLDIWVLFAGRFEVCCGGILAWATRYRRAHCCGTSRITGHRRACPSISSFKCRTPLPASRCDRSISFATILVAAASHACCTRSLSAGREGMSDEVQRAVFCWRQ